MVKANCPACGTEFEVAEAGVLSAPEAPAEGLTPEVEERSEPAVEAPVEEAKPEETFESHPEAVSPSENQGETLAGAVEAPAQAEEVAG